MNKIDEILSLKQQAESLSSETIDKLSALTRSTEKLIFSVNISNGHHYVILRDKRQDKELALDAVESEALLKFLDNIFNEATDKSKPKLEVKFKKEELK